jgi:hypothetical protein
LISISEGDIKGSVLHMPKLAVAGLAEILPQPPLTRNQVELMQIDTTASENRPGFRALGISPRSLEEELEAMLKLSHTQKTLTPGRG